MDAFEAVAREAAERAGAILREHWNRRKEAHRKSSSIDLVTETDRACEEAILETIRRAFPDHAILAEESGASPGSGHRWIVDPLDGTTNFVHGFPQISVSIALESRGEIVLGLVLDPLREETFFARRGAGATLNGEPLAVSEPATLSEALLGTGFPYDRREHADFYLSYFKAFLMRAHGIRRGGSAALDLAWVAAGRLDAFWEWRLHPWDVAAGALLVSEAGGRVGGFGGEPFDLFAEQILATNGRLHDAMRAVLAEIGTAPPGPGFA